MIPIICYTEKTNFWQNAFFILLLATTIFLLVLDSEVTKAQQEPQTIVIECQHSDPITVRVLPTPYEVEDDIVEETVAGKYSAITMSDAERAIVALTVYHEARGEGTDGMRAVLEVILNRVLSERWPSTATAVIYAPGQFAVASYLKTANINELDKLAQAFSLVDEVLSETEYILPDDYVYFATSKVNGKDFIQIGNHYFSK